MATISTIKLPDGTTHDIVDTVNVGYGTCSTTKGTAAKVVTISDTKWSLKVGSIIGVKFAASNSASNVTINVNNTGAKAVAYGTAYPYTGSSTTYCGAANTVIFYQYDGTYWYWLSHGSDSNSDTITAGYCVTGAAIAAKTASWNHWVATANSYGLINFRYANTAASALTLNINSTGAKPIYLNDVASSTTNYTLPAGSYIFFYDGTNYYISTAGKIPKVFSGSYNDLSNKPTIPTVNDATLTIQKNGTNVATFTANSSTDQTANIVVPTTATDIGAADGTKYASDGIHLDDSTVKNINVSANGTIDGSMSFICGANSRPSAGNLAYFPWLVSYLDASGILYPTLRGSGGCVIGNCKALSRARGTNGSVAIGGNNIIDLTSAGMALTIGTYNYVTATFCTALGRYLLAAYTGQQVFGTGNDNKAEDILEVGNGTVGDTEIERANAFRVTTSGYAIAQTGIGIENGDGTQTSVTAAQLAALLLLPSTKQDALVSGTNIKTINNNSILGSGNIEIAGGGADENAVHYTADSGKTSSDKLQARTNIGLENVDNTSDLDKPISTATQTALTTIENSMVTYDSSSVTPPSVLSVVDIIYPVGSIYMSTSSSNPSLLFSGTTWVQIKDKFLLGAGDTYSGGTTGGEATHTLTGYEVPSHTHGFPSNPWAQTGGYGRVTAGAVSTANMANLITSTLPAGGGQAHNNMPPYLTVYLWERTA